MLDQAIRTSILQLKQKGHGSRAIAKALGISRSSVRGVLNAKTAAVPRLARSEKAEPFIDDIRALYTSNKGNLVRVHEELVKSHALLSYQALTAFCRRHGIGHEPKKPEGHYHFGPGVEMQHDTSPHDVTIAGQKIRLQCASLVMCYSRRFYMQYYPSFDRFACKLFLTEAMTYFDGAAKTCMIDNTHVVVLHGTGKNMVPVPEMAAFAERFSFTFEAHEKGDANRSARVEGHFHFVENNFLAGRTFASLEDLNEQLRAWCDKVNATFSDKLHASRNELFAAERPSLRPLPIYVPEVYRLHHRIVDLEGYISVNHIRYSVPYQLISQRMEVRETKGRIEIYDGPRIVANHAKHQCPAHTRVTDPAHRPPRGGLKKFGSARPEEQEIIRCSPELADYLDQLKKHRSYQAVRSLARMVRDYPKDPLVAAVHAASTYGLYDIKRLERLVLRTIAKDFFNLKKTTENKDD